MNNGQEQRAGRVASGLTIVQASLAGYLAVSFLDQRLVWRMLTTSKWWILLVGFFLAERVVLHLPARRSAHTLTFVEFPLVFGLYLLPPISLLAALGVGTALALAVDPSVPWLRKAFNLSQYLLSMTIGIAVFDHVIDNPDAVTRPTWWVVAFLATGLSSAVGLVTIIVAMTLTEGRIAASRLRHMVGVGLGVSFGNTSVALLAAFSFSHDPAAMALLAVPLAVLFLAYRAYVVERHHNDHLELLNALTGELTAATDMTAGLELLLRRIHTALHSHTGEVVLFPSEPGGPALRLTVSDAGVVGLGPIHDPLVDRLANSSDGTGDALAAAYAKSRGLPDAIVAPLADGNGRLGMLLAGDRATFAGPFTAADARLFTTIAHHAAIVLRRDQLGQAFSELEDEQDRLRHDVYHDAVTGLGNRRLLAESLRRSLTTCNQVSVMMIDLDGFKAVNDELGHAAGDELLVRVAERICHALRSVDLAVRLGGDEFAVLLTDPSSEQEAEAVAGRILAAVGQPYHVGGGPARVGASIGIVTRPSRRTHPDELLALADEAMYQAKRSGKGRVVVHGTLVAPV